MKLPYTPEYTKKELEKMRQDEAREEELRFFNRPESMADFSYWCKMEYWKVDEAVALLLGRDPNQTRWSKVKDYADKHLSPSPFADKYARLRDLAHRKWSSTSYGFEDIVRVQPVAFLDWAGETGIDVPEELSDSISPRLDNIGSKMDRQIDFILGVIDSKEYNRMCVPTNGKERGVKPECLQKPDLFTENSFKKAWQEARDRGLLDVKDSEKYKT